MTREEILSKVFEKNNEDLDLWYVAYVCKNELGCIESNYAYFNERYDADKWFGEKTKDRAFYGYCCDKTYWNKVEELLGE